MKVFLSTAIIASLVAAWGFKAGESEFMAKPAADKLLSEQMEGESSIFDRIRDEGINSDECLPIRVGGMNQIDVEYLACSELAINRDRESFSVSDELTVPEGLARRVNFWRRVYSLWSKDQDVLHVAEYPEIIMEIHNSSRLAGIGDKARSSVMKPWLEARRQYYKKLLLKLAATSEAEALKLTGTELRVYKLFSHIENKNKFKIAAFSLRVQRGQREFIAKGLSTSAKYLPHAEAEFKGQGLMPELARIAFIESSFNLQALSKVGASGVYQVMPETGRDYLVVTPEIDERNDPIKASRAAAKLLAMNYKIIGSWPLAITAYNHGIGGISRAAREHGTKDITKLVNEYDGANFGFASKNFYCGFLGMLATLKNSAKVFPEIVLSPPLSFDLVRVGGMSLAEVKGRYKVTTATLSAYNPDIGRSFLRSGGTFPMGYKAKIPARNSGLPAASLVTWTP
jgi:membrane-bound lytic murein transglycosylase D